MLLPLIALVPLVSLLTNALPQQIPFTSPANSLIQNTQSDFSVLGHKHFPDHSVRIRTPKGLCDPNVEQKSGYLDNVANNRHFYFWVSDFREVILVVAQK